MQPFKRASHKPTLNLYVLAGAAMMLSAVATTGFFLWRDSDRPDAVDVADSSQSNPEPDGSDEPTAQPAVGTQMPERVPHHFTENLLVPGFTETGQQVEEQDNTLGRSPEGV